MLLNPRLTATVLLACFGGLVLTGCGGKDEKAEKPTAAGTSSAPADSGPAGKPAKKSGKKPTKAATSKAPALPTYVALDDARCAQVSRVANKAFGAPALQYRPEGGTCENLDDSFEGDDVDGKAVHVTVNPLPDRFPTEAKYVAELRAEADSAMVELRLDGWSYSTRVGSAYTLSRVVGAKVLVCSGQGYGSQSSFVAFCDDVRDVLLGG